MGFGIGADQHQTDAAREFFGYDGLDSDVLTAAHGSSQVVQILGAGDGGLQEALRFVLAPESQDFSKVVADLENALEQNHSAVWQRSLASLRTAEDQALRSFMWGYAQDVIFEELHDAYKSIIAELLTECRSAIDRWALGALRRTGIKVEVVGRGGFSKRVYPLNRFLTLLLAEAPQRARAQIRLVDEAHKALEPDVCLLRTGFASGEKPAGLGTASGDDLLQRIAFRGLPMNLDAVR